MPGMDAPPPVEVVAGCPVCGAVFEEAERIGNVRVSINSVCPRCATPADPALENQTCGPSDGGDPLAGSVTPATVPPPVRR
jgi:hypothetical protein